MRYKWLGCLALTVLAAEISAHASPTVLSSAERTATGVTEQEAASVVNALALALDRNFVFPKVGEAYAAMLRQRLGDGAYDSFQTKEEFAEAVTADLQALHKDGHLRLFAPIMPGTKSKYRTAPTAEGAIGRSGWLADGVAYINFTMFPGDPVTLGKIDAFLSSHSEAKSLIIDIRGHHGGDIKEVEVIGSYLFSKEEVVAHMDTRAAVDAAGASPFEESSTVRRISGPEGVVRQAHVISPGRATPLRKAQVFLLTSSRSVSAAEAFAVALKRTGRALLIGETTRGAGHFGDPYPLPNGYSAFIPVGRSFDPTTGESWEGIGVKPDIEVPADKALDEALKRAGAQVSGELALAQLK